MAPLLTIIVLSYIVGSIPTSIIVTRIARGIDIRDHGSGNAGGTNVFRVVGWKFGLLVIAIDILKGYLATIVIPKLMVGDLPFNNRTPFEDITVVRIRAVTLWVDPARAREATPLQPRDLWVKRYAFPPLAATTATRDRGVTPPSVVGSGLP